MFAIDQFDTNRAQPVEVVVPGGLTRMGSVDAEDDHRHRATHSQSTVTACCRRCRAQASRRCWLSWEPRLGHRPSGAVSARAAAAESNCAHPERFELPTF